MEQEGDSPTMDADHIGSQTRRGISWNLFGAATTNAMRLVVVVVLGRALSSYDFGVVAAAISVITVLHAFRDLGVGAALIQRQTLDPGHVETAFAVSLYLGVARAVIVLAAAPLVGRLYHIEDSVDLLRALAPIFALRGLATTSMVMCQRAMNFRAVAIIDTASFCAGSITSMVLAIAGMGPWALIIGYLVEEGSGTIAYLIVKPPRLSLRVDRDRLRDLLGFGVGHTVIQIANVLAIQGDNAVVGNQLGPEQLGFYARAYDMIKLPALVFIAIVGNVLFPAFSRMQNDRERMRDGFRRVIFANALFVLPASALLIAIAPEVIRILMGPHWGSAVLPFQILAVTMLMRISYIVGQMVAMAAGAIYSVAIANVIYAAAVILGALVTSRWGTSGVAVSTALSLVLIYLLCSYYGMQQCDLGWRGFAGAHLHGFGLGLAVIAAAWPLAQAMRHAGLPGVVTAIAVSLVSGAIAIAAIAFWTRRARGDFAWLRSELERIHAKLRRR